MRTNTVFNGNGSGQNPLYPPAWVLSQFWWIPNYCQANTTSYVFNVSQYKQQQGQDSAGLSNIFIYHVNITNMDRPPQITTELPASTLVYVGNTLHFDLQASDADMLECGDDALSWNYSLVLSAVGPVNFSGNGSNASFTWVPQSGDVGLHILDFIVQDLNGSMSSKTVNVTVYQPVYRPSCWYDKRIPGYVCA